MELAIKQILAEESPKLIAQPGISSQLIVTTLEGTISRYIRSKFKEAPSSYSENLWTLIVLSTFFSYIGISIIIKAFKISDINLKY